MFYKVKESLKMHCQQVNEKIALSDHWWIFSNREQQFLQTREMFMKSITNSFIKSIGSF